MVTNKSGLLNQGGLIADQLFSSQRNPLYQYKAAAGYNAHKLKGYHLPIEHHRSYSPLFID